MSSAAPAVGWSLGELCLCALFFQPRVLLYIRSCSPRQIQTGRGGAGVGTWARGQPGISRSTAIRTLLLCCLRYRGVIPSARPTARSKCPRLGTPAFCDILLSDRSFCIRGRSACSMRICRIVSAIGTMGRRCFPCSQPAGPWGWSGESGCRHGCHIPPGCDTLYRRNCRRSGGESPSRRSQAPGS